VSESQLLTTKQAARLLNVHANTVKRLAKSGKLAHHVISDRGDLRFDRADIDAWLASKRKDAAE
jgi:excisionase family DNA binding protein